MVLPLLKIFSLGIRVFTKPLLNHLKEVQKQSLTRDHKLSEFFIKIGNQQYLWETKLNRRLMNIQTDFDMFTKPLNEEIALEKGIEFFYSVLFYGIIVAVCTYEITKNFVKGQKKKEEDKERLALLEQSIELSSSKIDEIEEMYQEKFKKLKIEIRGINMKMDRILKESSQTMNKESKLGNVLEDLMDKYSDLEARIESEMKGDR